MYLHVVMFKLRFKKFVILWMHLTHRCTQQLRRYLFLSELRLSYYVLVLNRSSGNELEAGRKKTYLQNFTQLKLRKRTMGVNQKQRWASAQALKGLCHELHICRIFASISFLNCTPYWIWEPGRFLAANLYL